jgi:N-acetylmuramoyl-L-alanine amidase
MRYLASLVIFLLTLPVSAETVRVQNIRIWSAPDNTRIVFDVSAPVRHSISMLDNPYRLVIDLKDAAGKQDLIQPAATDKYLQRLRGATRNDNDWRYVLDLKKYSRSKSFQLPPNKQYGHRLVIDVFDSEKDQQLRAETIEAAASSSNFRELLIAIDAGHGGEDPGSIGPGGTYEKTVVFKVAQRLADMINREHGMRALMVREGDYYMPLRKRITRARQFKADMFISIHADSFKDPGVHGASVYVLSQKGASSEYARWLAARENASDLIGGVSLEDKDNVLASVLLDLSQTASLEASIEVAEEVLGGLRHVGKLHKPRVEAAGFAVLKSPDIPSILVETAYISNPEEERKLLDPAHQSKIARSIMQGVQTYFSKHAPAGALLATRQHTIVRGDTLSTIAQRYKVSLEHLRNLNGLQGDYVQAGQVLAIPAGGG